MEDWSLPTDVSSIAKSIATPRRKPDVREAQVAYWEFLKSSLEVYGYQAISTFFPTVTEGLARHLKMKAASGFDKISFSEICSIKPALSDEKLFALLSLPKSTANAEFSSPILKEIHSKFIPVQLQYWSTVKHIASSKSGNLELRKCFPHVSTELADVVAGTNLLALMKLCEQSCVSTICSSISDNVLLGNLGSRPDTNNQFKLTLQLLSSSPS